MIILLLFIVAVAIENFLLRIYPPHITTCMYVGIFLASFFSLIWSDDDADIKFKKSYKLKIFNHMINKYTYTITRIALG